MTTSSSGWARPAFDPSVWHVRGYDVAIRDERSRENVTRFSLVTTCSARR